MKTFNTLFTAIVCFHTLHLAAIPFRVSNTDTTVSGFPKTVYVGLFDAKIPTIMRTVPLKIEPGKTVTIDAPRLGNYKMRIQFEGLMEAGRERYKDIDIKQSNELLKLGASELKKFYDELKPIQESREKERQEAIERLKKKNEEARKRAEESAY